MHSNTHMYFCASSFFPPPKAKLVFLVRCSTPYIFHFVIAVHVIIDGSTFFLSLFKNCYLTFTIAGGVLV